MKTWKRRWFILTDNCLYYFEYTTVSTGPSVFVCVGTMDCELFNNIILLLELDEEIDNTLVIVCSNIKLSFTPGLETSSLLLKP